MTTQTNQEEKREKVMYNIIATLPFYREKSAMIIKTSMGQKYGEATPFIEFKFTQRADRSAKGDWDDRNVFWFTSYTELWSLVKDLKFLHDSKEHVKVDKKNPMKKTAVCLFTSKSEKTGVEYVNFQFHREDLKILVSLHKQDEFPAVYEFFKSLLATYPIVAQSLLVRSDIWYYNNFIHQQSPSSFQKKGNSTYVNKQDSSKGSSIKDKYSLADSLEEQMNNFDTDSDSPF